MTHQEAVAAVLARLPEPRAGRPVLVCIEGFGGAGKSSLAGALAKAQSGELHVVHGDDFYGPERRDWRSWTPREGYQRYFDHRRLERELLAPLRSGSTARFQRYDWLSHALDGWVAVTREGTVVVEGVCTSCADGCAPTGILCVRRCAWRSSTSPAEAADLVTGY